MNESLNLEHSKYQALSQLEAYNVLIEITTLQEEIKQLKYELSQKIDASA